MKHFLFTIEVVSSKKAAYETKQTKLWSVVKNIPTLLGKRNSQFEADMQCLMNLAEQVEALPAKYFESHPMGGMNWTPARLREQGIAQFHQL